MDNHEGNVLNYFISIYHLIGGDTMPQRKDITGQVFDELTVIEMLYNYQNKHRTYCKCIGIDGNEYIIRQDALISGATHQIKGVCKAGTPNDISGDKYGKLTPIEPTKMRESNHTIKWKCLCDCGNVTYASSSQLKRGHVTSCGCAKQEYVESTKSDVIGKTFGYLTVLKDSSTKLRNRRTVICQCQCGKIEAYVLEDLRSKHVISCGCINQSRGELFIEELLKSNNISYDKQKRFDNCKDKRTLPFDFYLSKFNTCIEYDGQQHFKPIKYWGGEDSFNILKKHDSIKTKYCNDNNINLIRIPYTKTNDEIIDIINNLISPATITA